MAQEVGHHFCDGCRSGCITNAPTGHCIGFGNTVNQNGSLFYRVAQRCHAGEGTSIIQQFEINLIGNDVQIMLYADIGQRNQLFPIIQHTGGVGRVIQNQSLGFRRNCLFQLLRCEFEILGFRRIDNHTHTADHTNHFIVADPIRSRQNHLVPCAGLYQNRQCCKHIMLCTTCNNNLGVVIIQIQITFQAGSNCFPQRNNAGSRCVFGFSFLNGTDTGFLNVFGGIKIRFAGTKPNNIKAISLHLFCFGVNCQSC